METNGLVGFERRRASSSLGLAAVALGVIVIIVSGCDSKDTSPPATEDSSEAPHVAPDVTDPGDVAPDVGLLPDAPEDTGPPPECGPGSTSPLPDPCNDYDACTTDSCVEGRCVRTEVVDCCKTDDQCDDGIACTDDRCNRIRNRCESVRGDSFCCVTTDDCEDFDACTENACAANRCVYPVKASCPVANPALCNDQNDCTSDLWSASGLCTYSAVGGPGSDCCEDDAACDDGLPDTVDRCQNARCWHGAAGCESDADCTGTGSCSTGVCIDNSCSYPDTTTCCETDAECDDSIHETTDRCVEHRCVQALVERRCTVDAECPSSGPCVAATCVSGYCSAAPSAADGCCRALADCAAPARCEDVSCVEFACVTAAAAEPRPIWQEDFTDLARWSVTPDASGATWQTRESQYISAPTSLYYGTAAGGFDVGPTHGLITSDPIALPTAVLSETLSVSLWRNILVEAISSRDLVTLEVLSGDQATAIWDKSFDNGPGLAWRLDTVALPPGLSGSIRFRFGFDTIDAIDNVGQGAFIDDLKLLAPCP